MNLQIIKSIDGTDEYVLLPMPIYKALHVAIEEYLDKLANNDDYSIFELSDYVQNPVAYARIKAQLTQNELAQRMGVTQAYISKIENSENVSVKLLQKVKKAIANKKRRS